jgi:hypothetical protein
MVGDPERNPDRDGAPALGQPRVGTAEAWLAAKTYAVERDFRLVADGESRKRAGFPSVQPPTVL